MKTRALWVTVIGLILAAGRGASAEEGPIGGVDLGVVMPVGRMYDRADNGGVLSPYAGYMFNDYLGVTAQAQVVGAPNRHVDGIPESDAVAPVRRVSRSACRVAAARSHETEVAR